ncbi:MAG TPA: cell envelope integrity protein TolA [Nevskiales bacterium]|nr:cell envelope integrity protein TolA [Nevskiales bacterium]
MASGQDNRAKAITFAVLLHVVLAAILVLGIEFSDYRPLSGPKVEIVEAEIIPAPSKPRIDPEAERRKREAEERQRREAQEAERRRQAEAREQQQQADAQRKQAALEAQKKAEAARQKAEQEARKKAEQEARTKAEQAARAKAQAEAEARQKAEAEARARAEAEARRKAEAEQQAREKALQEALAQEQRERELNPLRDAYSAAISQQIARNWLKPPGISDDLKCEALVVQLPDGSVASARISKSSGNAAFDESVIKAIYKAAPLPQPPIPEVFERELEIAFCSTGNVC